jgi:hypothetical protein
MEKEQFRNMDRLTVLPLYHYPKMIKWFAYVTSVELYYWR